MIELVSLQEEEETIALCLLSKWGHSEKGAVYKLETEPSLRTCPYWHPNLGFPSLQNLRNKYLLFKPPSLWYLVTVNQTDQAWACMCLVTQSCPALCNPLDYSPLDPSVHGCASGKNTGVNCYALIQGIFLTQGSNPCLLCWSQILYHLCLQGNRSLSSHFLVP